MGIQLRVFKATMASVNFIFPNGKPAIFQSGVYRTADEGEIQQLDYEISKGHPHIYVDPNEREVDSEMIDPMAVLRARHIAEYLEEQKRAMNADQSLGETDKNAPLMAASTRDIAAAAVGGSGESITARLANLTVKA